MQREYIIVCNEYKGTFPGALLFWGHRTEDGETRSFGGYTSDIDNCECYTLEEIRRKGLSFPVCDTEMDLHEFRQISHVIIKKEDLLRFSWLKSMRVIYVP